MRRCDIEIRKKPSVIEVTDILAVIFVRIIAGLLCSLPVSILVGTVQYLSISFVPISSSFLKIQIIKLRDKNCWSSEKFARWGNGPPKLVENKKMKLPLHFILYYFHILHNPVHKKSNMCGR